MEIQTIGIDLGKTLFHLVGVDASGSVVVRKRCSRSQLVAFTANLRVQRIGMEACSGSHFLGRTLRDQGHDVRLMPAQYVKPYVKTNKSDYIDAEAIAEAVQRPTMRFVPIKTEDQLDLQAVHRVRERCGVPEPGIWCADFVAAMDDDLGTPAALAAIHTTVHEGNTALGAGDHPTAIAAAGSVRAMTGVLGLDPLADHWRATSASDAASAALAVRALLRICRRSWLCGRRRLRFGCRLFS